MEYPQHISYITEIPSVEDLNNLLTVPVRNWVESQFQDLNEVQKLAIPRIANNKSTLVMAPTGAGKTLAAFLGIISELQKMEQNDQLEEKIYALYISPLKALNNDIHKNLEIPLKEIKRSSGTHITAAKRTGDTPTKERRRLLQHPPHILITTPESLGLMLAAPKFKENLRSIKWIIVDEIHSIADNKRGTLLSVCLERLEYYLKKETTRIGLSATVEPVELVGNYLMGNREYDLGLIDMGRLRELDLEVISPVRNLVRAPFSSIKTNQLDYIRDYLEHHKTILIFTNTRHLSENLVYDLIERVDDEIKDKIAVHHGSLDKKVRLDVENRLKQGKMKAVLTSTSLEMGIDIGSIDLTIQLGSPKTVRSLLQRIGRSGHSQELISKGKILVFNRDDLLECVAIAKLALEGKIDAIRIPEEPYDVLVQMLVGMAVEKKWDIDEAYKIIKHSYPYRSLSYENYLDVLRYAADPFEGEHAWKYGHIWIDEEINKFGRRRSAKQAYLQNIGTIPDVTTIDVVLEGYRTTIGQISEKFTENLQENDIFILGGKTFEFVRSIGNKVLVRDAFGMVPTIPSWGGEAQSRSWEISQEIDYMLGKLENFLKEDKEKAIKWLRDTYPIGMREAEAIVHYAIEQLSLAPLPRLDRINVEAYIDPSGTVNLLFLMVYGLETNRALAQAIGSLLSSKLGSNVGFISTDNGVLLKIPPGIDYDHNDIIDDLSVLKLKNRIKQSLRDTELFKLRFRHAAARSLMILRRWGNHINSVSQQQRTARWLSRQLEPEMPIISETFREIMYDTFNVNRAEKVLNMIKSSDIEIKLLQQSDVPSSMTHEILLNGELDVVMVDDRRSLLLSLHQQVLSRLLPNIQEFTTILNTQQVQRYFEEKFQNESLARNVIYWAEFTKKFDNPIETGAKTIDIDAEEFLELLSSHPKIVKLPSGNYTTYDLLPSYAATSKESFWDDFDLSNPLIERAFTRSSQLSPEEGWEELIIHYVKYAGPSTLSQIILDLESTEEQIKSALMRLVRRRVVLQGNFISSDREFILFDDREQIVRTNKPSDRITEEELRDFRLLKMRLIPKSRTSRIAIEDYLLNNGPTRTPIELVARLDNFKWAKLRNLIANQKVYFGRFLGRRLVFIHEHDLEDFVRITRSNEQLDEYSQNILTIIAERPGLTQKDLTKITKLPYTIVQESINKLEHELYISRIGYELSLIHGGFPNPRYLALPQVDTTSIEYLDAVERIIKRCCQWYGPLTLNDLLRITRLPYQTIEEALEQLDLSVIRILGGNYYGFDYDFDELQKIDLEDKDKDSVTLLSQLDPYFYMLSGSFRRDQFPRHTRLIILYQGMPQGYIEIAIPDKDILQIINLKLNKKNIKDFNFIRSVGTALLHLGKFAYQTPVVYIEEINYKPVNHTENELIITVLSEVGYYLQLDHLVGGTLKKDEYSKDDVVATRQLARRHNVKTDTSSLENIFCDLPVLSVDETLNLMETTDEKAKLMISHYLRTKKIHYRKGKLYRHDIYTALFGKVKTNHKIIKILDRPLVSREIAQKLGLSVEEITKELNELFDQGLIEIVSPFAKVFEYRCVPLQIYNFPERLNSIIKFVISQFGPISYGKIMELSEEYIQISRSQLLFTLVDLLEQHEIKLTSVNDEYNNSREVMYFDDRQASILTDPAKMEYFDEWDIYKSDENIFEEVPVQDTHVLVNKGNPVASFKFNQDKDTGIIENLSLLPKLVDISPNPFELALQIEEFVFKKGYLRLQINKIQETEATFWLDLGG